MFCRLCCLCVFDVPVLNTLLQFGNHSRIQGNALFAYPQQFYRHVTCARTDFQHHIYRSQLGLQRMMRMFKKDAKPFGLFL